MKRFKIKNKVNGLEFQVEADSLKLQPEYGKPAWTETRITPAVLDEQGQEITPEVIETIDHLAEYEIIEEDITEQLAQAKANQEALAYLSKTDWYIVRQMDSGEPVPPEVKQKRAEARERIK